jgi:hypothetical protein
MKYIFFVLLTTFFFSCNDRTADKTKDTKADTASGTAVTDPVADNPDTLVVDKNTAVYYWPDAAGVAKWEKKLGKEAFQTGADDMIEYRTSTSRFLDSMKLSLVKTEDHKFIKFIKADQSFTLIKPDTISNLWGIYLFTPGKEPKFANFTMIEDEYKTYFK